MKVSNELTIRVLSLLAEGKKSPEIAKELCVSVNTLYRFIEMIRAKLGAETNEQMIYKSIKKGLLS